VSGVEPHPYEFNDFQDVPLDFDRTTLFIGFFGCHCAFNRSMLGVDRCWVSIDAAGQSRDGLLVRSLEVQVDRQVFFDYFMDGLDYSCFAAFLNS
jgi:hypothetical protein